MSSSAFKTLSNNTEAKENKSIDEEEQKIQHDSLPLDWTKLSGKAELPPSCRVVFPWDVQPESLEEPNEVKIIGTHGQKITLMGRNLSDMYSPDIKTLILRSHLIGNMEGLRGFANLEVLELYDNSIGKLQDLNNGENGEPGFSLRILDMSYNVIRDMTPVQFCPNLVELYLAQNKIKQISGLKNLSNLRKLDLGANRISVMEPNEISTLTNLEELWLGKNKIKKIQGLEKLTKLLRLDIQSNRLTCVENLTSQIDTLEELYLSGNGIKDEGLSLSSGINQQFKRLNTLDLSKNKLTTTKYFVKVLSSLEDLWISGNFIESFDETQFLSASTKLEVIYLEFNPIASDYEYRKKLKEIIGPSLNQIDSDQIIGQYDEKRFVGNIISTEDKLQQMQEKALSLAKKGCGS